MKTGVFANCPAHSRCSVNSPASSLAPLPDPPPSCHLPVLEGLFQVQVWRSPDPDLPPEERNTLYPKGRGPLGSHPARAQFQVISTCSILCRVAR